MLKFQITARVVRSFNEGDKEIDIMQRILESLIEHVNALSASQEVTTENLNAILIML